MDVFDKDKRSKIMRSVRGENTGPELRVRKILHAAGYRFRLHRKDLPGSPDIFLPKHRIAVLVHGCFWHGHACRRAKLPETRTGFWALKISKNIERDKAVVSALAAQGIRSVVLWQCEISPDAVLNALSELLDSA
ncbi:MAG: very short patch repair endonuclease [Sphingomonadales bacterium 32-68-7]|nr:MAG: very short patch repair endonuclease [Sphingomonadales bacterium 12-68-11]OYX08464.1 MAG: very short patch repair endonuclease [Sphingomonadales bacterium 32-68-7]